MKKALKILGVIFVVLLLAGVITYMVLPSSYDIRRTRVLNATPATIHETVRDVKTWTTWTPWTVEAYPDMKVTFGDTTVGEGASYSWTSKDAGVGRLVITEDNPETGIKIDLFFEDDPNPNKAEINWKVENGKTNVEWRFYGDADGIYRIMMPLMSSVINEEFDKCLAGLDTFTSKSAETPVVN